MILVLLLGTGAYLACFLPQVEINANTDAFMEEESEEVTTYYETRAEWGTDEFAIVCVTADDWFTPAGRARLQEIVADIEAAPFVASTMSVFDVPLLRQDPDRKPRLLKLKEHMTNLGSANVDLGRARDELRNHELARGNLISADGRSINILAYLDWSREADVLVPPINVRREKMIAGVRELSAKWTARLSEPVRISGLPLIQRTLVENIRHDLIVFGVAALVLFSLALLVVYRDLRFVVIPVLCCLLPAVGMLGAMSRLEIPVALVTSNMPVLLFVLMLPYNVYFIERYRERRALYEEESSFASTLGALRTIALPCFFSCATTLAGFVALSTSKIIPIRDFGETMTVGMTVGFCVVFLFLPAAMHPVHGIMHRARHKASYRPSSGLVRLFEKATLGRPGWVVLVALLVLAVAIGGARRITAESKFTSYFWPDSEIYQGLEFIDQEVGGTTWIEVVLSSEKEGFFKTKEGLRAIETVEDYFADMPELGNILSLVSLRDEMRKTFRKEWFPLVTDSTLLTLINLAEPELVSKSTNGEFTSTRITIRMKETAPTLHRNRVLDGLEQHLAAHAEVFANIEEETTGVFQVYADMLSQLWEGLKQSIVVVPLAVYLMLVLLFRSPVLALVVLIPQALPATVLLGIMGWAGIPLDIVTVMIASIAIGVGIDAAIQYTMRFRDELKTTGDHREAIRRSHATIGRAIWNATSIIVAGFAILALSRFFPTFWFGIFTAAAMLLSQLATLTVLPSLFLLTGYPKMRDPEPGREGSTQFTTHP